MKGLGFVAVVAFALYLFLFGEDEATSSSDLSSRDAVFLSAVGDRFDYADEDLINIGKAVCLTLDEEPSLDGVSGQFTGTGISTYDGAYLAGAAVAAYCPEYEHLFN